MLSSAMCCTRAMDASGMTRREYYHRNQQNGNLVQQPPQGMLNMGAIGVRPSERAVVFKRPERKPKLRHKIATRSCDADFGNDSFACRQQHPIHPVCSASTQQKLIGQALACSHEPWNLPATVFDKQTSTAASTLTASCPAIRLADPTGESCDRSGSGQQ